MHTPNEARLLRCPIEKESCVAEQCAMWRWSQHAKVKNDRHVNDMGFCNRTLNVLMAGGIDTESKLMDMTDFMLLLIPNLGRRSLNEIRKTIGPYNPKNTIYIKQAGYCGLAEKPEF